MQIWLEGCTAGTDILTGISHCADAASLWWPVLANHPLNVR